MLFVMPPIIPPPRSPMPAMFPMETVVESDENKRSRG